MPASVSQNQSLLLSVHSDLTQCLSLSQACSKWVLFKDVLLPCLCAGYQGAAIVWGMLLCYTLGYELCCFWLHF